jgi:hypothetical protein
MEKTWEYAYLIPGLIKSLKIERTSSTKSPLAPLFQRGVIPPFDKACLPAGRGGEEGFYDQCLHYYETLYNKERMVR